MFKKCYIALLIFCFLFSLFQSNPATLSSSNPIYPTSTTYITSYYGYRELFGKQNFHNGIDFAAPRGSPIHAILDGVVTFAGFTNGYGICVTILHTNGLKSLYGHMEENIILHHGDTVSQGQVIGYVGPKILSNGKPNGWTTGPHLHLSLFDTEGNTFDPLTLPFEMAQKKE